MLTSFVQYLLLLPSYVNILLIYAMCNLHDVSWGTKGDNGSSKDLGAAKKVEKDGKEMAEVALPTKQEDVEALWQQARQELRVPVKEKAEKRSPETKRADGTSTLLWIAFESLAWPVRRGSQLSNQCRTVVPWFEHAYHFALHVFHLHQLG